MDDKDFNRLADEMLADRGCAEASEADLDFELGAGGVLKSSLPMTARSSSIAMRSPRKSGLRRGLAASISLGWFRLARHP